MGERLRVLIAGGGVAGAEALLALRAVLGVRVELELVAPTPDFVYRPLALAEPFGLGETHVVQVDRLAAARQAAFRLDRLTGVDDAGRTAVLASGGTISYDALLLAVGARPVAELDGALTYSGPQSNDEYRDLLQQVKAGEVKRIVFAALASPRWTVPLYELALLTSHYARTSGVDDLELTIVTPESTPLEMFGARASESVLALLNEAGVGMRRASVPTAVTPDGLAISGQDPLPADRVVTLPRLEVEPIDGVPQGPQGFIGTDVYMRVEKLRRIYAAGDATWFPIKQGGLAAQQADVAATAIASLVDPAIAKIPFRPVLRGAILTGAAPRYLRAEVGDRQHTSAAGTAPLWWPPSKIAARYLAPYLASGDSPDEPALLGDVPPLHGEDPAEAARDHEEAVELALSAAEADARWRDYENALRWLRVAEQLNLTLPSGFEQKRMEWQSRLREVNTSPGRDL